MSDVDKLAIQCGVSRGTIYRLAKQLGGRMPTEEEVNNRPTKKTGRPPKYKL